MSPPLYFPGLMAAALAGGPVMFAKGFAAWRRRRLIADTPGSKIRSMAMGLVEVQGTAIPRSTVTAPFSGKTGVYWKVDVSTRSKDSWSVIHRESSSQPFYLRDETGVALVYPQGADCRLVNAEEEVCSGVALPDCYAEYLRAHPSVMSVFGRLGSMRFREWLVEENTALFVFGTATPKARVFEIGDAEAFAATGTDGPGAVAVRASRLATLDGEVHATIRRGENEPTFVISEQSQITVLNALGLKSVGYIVLGPILTLLGLAYWLSTWSHGRLP